MLITSPEEMYNLGESLAKDHKILLLQWELGSGKTTLAKGFAKWLGLDPTKVQSPTYTYLNIYEDKLLHIDMRRLNDHKELVEKGILDQINQFDHVIIERPKHTHLLWLPKATIIDIKKTSPTTREVSIKIQSV
jgi:tRNA threonylcarbamoyladenosine biosynthesis protein TsaE